MSRSLPDDPADWTEADIAYVMTRGMQLPDGVDPLEIDRFRIVTGMEPGPQRPSPWPPEKPAQRSGTPPPSPRPDRAASGRRRASERTETTAGSGLLRRAPDPAVTNRDQVDTDPVDTDDVKPEPEPQPVPEAVAAAPRRFGRVPKRRQASGPETTTANGSNGRNPGPPPWPEL